MDTAGRVSRGRCPIAYQKFNMPVKFQSSPRFLTVVVVVDSHIQRIVLATEETTVTQQVSHRPVVLLLFSSH